MRKPSVFFDFYLHMRILFGFYQDWHFQKH